MYLAINLDDFDSHFIMLSEKTKNNVMSNSDFYRLYYSDTYYNSNGLYVFFGFDNLNISKYFNKMKGSFKKSDNKHLITKLQLLEKNILKLFPIKRKSPIYRITEQLNNGFIKIFGDYEQNTGMRSFQIVLKISGIWSDVDQYGLTFRFYIANRLL